MYMCAKIFYAGTSRETEKEMEIFMFHGGDTLWGPQVE